MTKGPKQGVRQIALIDPSSLSVIQAVFAGESHWPLLITGPAGTGKTCAALAFLDCVMTSRRYSAAADYVNDTMAAAKGELSRGSYNMGSREWLAYWEDAGITCIDELGSREKVPDWHYEIIKKVMDIREDKPSIWISNLSLEDLERVYDDRIASRLAAGTHLAITGDDRRLTERI